MHLENPTKAELARSLGVSRASLYYEPVLPKKDWVLKIRIEQVLHEHPSYGHRRLAPALNVNKKRVRRVMALFGIKPYRRRGRKPTKARDLGQVPAAYQNWLLAIPFPERAGVAWVSDFTYIPFRGRFLYLATVVDLFTREVVGWSVWTAHDTQLVLLALIDALEKRDPAQYLHSDQGSEYRARTYCGLAERAGITVSMSHKSSPWENGYQESFYSQFKVDLGDPGRFGSVGELTAEIYRLIHSYNHGRIHTSLKMPPSTFAERQRNAVPLS
jgi:transposase InsO family protein